MRRVYVLLIIVITVFLYGNIYEVDINSTAQFSSIQTAINYAGDTDSILVYPGTYQENINYQGKSLSIYSLYILTEENNYITSTVIDGTESGSCVLVINNEEAGTVLCGFTLTNGSGYVPPPYILTAGGGILAGNCQLRLEHCIIEGNYADEGGGIATYGTGTVNLKGCTIRNNYATYAGGGLCTSNSPLLNLNFDGEKKNSIYNNHASKGADIGVYYQGGNLMIDLDTFTCADYWGYNALQCLQEAPWLQQEGFSLTFDNVFVQSALEDLYVSPTGNDSNPGLSENEPLKTISWALQKIAGSTGEMFTIHLAPGVYSQTATNELLPLNIKGDVTICGAGNNESIIDAEDGRGITLNFWVAGKFRLENVKLINGNGDFLLSLQTIELCDIELENIIIENTSGSMIYFSSTGDVTINNARMIDNGTPYSTTEIFIPCYTGNLPKNINLSNIILEGNHGPMFHIIGSYDTEPQVCLQNILLHDNHIYDNGITGRTAFIYLFQPQQTSIVNCTIGENNIDMAEPGFLVKTNTGVDLNVINSIFFANDIDYFLEFDDFDANELNILNSSFEYTQENLVYNNSSNLQPPHFMDNLYENNPLFDDFAQNPLYLSADSPCINSGLNDLTPFGIQLLEYDLINNTRIYDDVIDMGAYEYHPQNDLDNNEIIKNELICYPNPVYLTKRNNITFNFPELSETDNAYADIYNIKGQKINSLGNISTDTIIWNGLNSNNQEVTSGIYFIKIMQNNKTISKRKFTVIR